MSSPSDRQPAILLVEDDTLFSDAVQRYLRTIVGEQCEVLQLSDSHAALMLLDQRNVRLVITDYHLLASMNGLKLAAEIRRRAPATRIALITAYATDEVHHAAAEAGVDYYLPKPFLVQDLEPIVRTVLTIP